MTATAKIFMHGRSQAVRLPKEFRLPGKEVRVSRVGDKVILEPLEKAPFDVAAWRAELVAAARRSGNSCPKTGRLWRTTTFRSTDPVFCLDTNVVIFAINERRPKIVERLHRELAAGTPMLVPAIVMFELEYGCTESKRREHSRRALEIFLSAGFDQPLFDVEDAREAGEIRAVLEASGQPIGPYDTLIAAQARRRRATLVTLNAREFERVPGLRVEDWAA